MVEVLKTGFCDTIQDLGRIGYQAYGVPFSGAMDFYSASLANRILGNDNNAAVIESVMFGPKLRFSIATEICITGAYMNPMLNSEVVKHNVPISVEKGDVLQFGKLEYGFRVYVAVLGGFMTEEKMNSRSMYSAITSKLKLSKGDTLECLSKTSINHKPLSSVKINKKHFSHNEFEVFKGPEFNQLSKQQQDLLFDNTLTISKDSNRMAYQFEDRITHELGGIITSLVLPGTVQLTPSGQLLILMRDCQTTGGYPRILQLTESSINRLSQQIFGKKIRFKCII
ncbi:biotin-dependent carboxyltransferase family protein [uncultured Psychroserpens sp.]|uniref:5-oxoprolinase subunit C family protein n=1 Tax=uncultured Psychroserpens sp. TaxID=255436 RepID=UPI002628AC41|nr:biotin-dependent carboxyltransferase family protein [uncultured Psychroserpens sp.]